MAILVLVLWLFTAGAGFSLLASSNLSRTRPSAPAPVAEPAPVAASAPVTQAASTPGQAASTPGQAVSTPGQAVSTSAQATAEPPRRPSRDRFAPPSLVAARNAPVVPGLRALLEFAHPASAIIGLGFWLGFTFVHYRPLGWIAFGLVTATIGLGLAWFAANTRAARRRLEHNREPHNAPEPHNASEPQGNRQDASGPSFSTRLIALHGGAAAVTVTLAALTAFVLGR